MFSDSNLFDFILSKRIHIRNLLNFVLIILISEQSAIITLKKLDFSVINLNADKKYFIQTKDFTKKNNISHKGYWNDDLFGHQNNSSFNPKRELSKSSLDVKIVGIVASDNYLNSIVIIAEGNLQKSLFVGDTIPNTSAIIKSILDERIIVSNNNILEYIGMSNVDSSTRTKKTDLKGIKQKIKNNPQQLFDYVSIAPVNENGVLKGYRLNKGKNPTLFDSSGLMPNDLAISINGYDLRDTDESASFMLNVNQQTHFDITVLRDDAEANISVDINE